MILSPRKTMTAMFFLTAFAFCAGLALIGGHALAQKPGANPGQGNTTTTTTNNPDGSTTTTTTTTHKDGSTTTTTNYDKQGHESGSTAVDKQTKDGETTTTTITRDGNGHETGKTIEIVDKDGNKTIIIIDPATGGEKSRKTVPAGQEGPRIPLPWNPNPGKPSELPPYKPKWDWKIEPKYNWRPLTLEDYKFDTKTSPGVNSEIITTPHGKLIVNLPDELYAGDTFSGTVVTEPAGKTEAERSRNQDQLNGVVLEIGQQKMRVAEKIFTRTIPANLTREAQSLNVIVNGKTVVNAPIPISGAAPAPPPANVQLPTCGQMGRNVVVKDHCDGIIAPTDSCSIGGTQLQPLAESPRMRVMQNTSEVPGLTEIKYREQGKEVTGPFQNLGVKLTSPNTNLLRNQKTTMEVVALVQGIQKDVSLDLVNDTPSVVSLSGGDNQHFTIHPADVQADGTYRQNFTVTANSAGAWGATATVSCVGAEGPSGPVAGGPQAASSPKGVAAPGTLALFDCVRACVRDEQLERGNCPRCLVQLDCVRACVRAASPAGVAALGTPTPTPTPSPAGPTPTPTPTPASTPSACGPTPTPTTYSVMDLGPLSKTDTHYCIATGVNYAGNVVGVCDASYFGASGGVSHAFRTEPGAVIKKEDDLGFPVGATGSASYATGVNASGHVVGWWTSGAVSDYKAFWHDGSKMSKMINLHPAKSIFTISKAFALNKDDDVVGAAYGLTVGPGSTAGITFGGHAVIWPGADPKLMKDLNDDLDVTVKKDWILIAAFGISDDGDIVGRALNKKIGKYHAFLLKGAGGKFFDLGALKEDIYDSSAAYAINACDETVPEIDKVVGYTDKTKAVHYGFIWTEAGGLMDMGTLPPYSSIPDSLESYAQAINKKGEVVGAVSPAFHSSPIFQEPVGPGASVVPSPYCAPNSHAVWYNGSELKDLNKLISASPGWELNLANGINDKGQIAGSGFYKLSCSAGLAAELSMDSHAVLLTPSVALTPPAALTPAPAPAPGPTGLPPAPTTSAGGYIFDNTNTYGVWNGPTHDTTFTIDKAYYITYIEDYHWNDGKGAPPDGKGISLKSSDGTVYGPWKVTASPGQGGAPNVNWECKPPAGFTLPAGTYTVVDPDPATWSLNAASGSSGFCRIAGYPKK